MTDTYPPFRLDMGANDTPPDTAAVTTPQPPAPALD
jgi:hypothetical protein